MTAALIDAAEHCSFAITHPDIASMQSALRYAETVLRREVERRRRSLVVLQGCAGCQQGWQK